MWFDVSVLEGACFFLGFNCLFLLSLNSGVHLFITCPGGTICPQQHIPDPGPWRAEGGLGQLPRKFPGKLRPLTQNAFVQSRAAHLPGLRPHDLPSGRRKTSGF